jgi:Ca2+-binding RTX toxin-like protein
MTITITVGNRSYDGQTLTSFFDNQIARALRPADFPTFGAIGSGHYATALAEPGSHGLVIQKIDAEDSDNDVSVNDQNVFDLDFVFPDFSGVAYGALLTAVALNPTTGSAVSDSVYLAGMFFNGGRSDNITSIAMGRGSNGTGSDYPGSSLLYKSDNIGSNGVDVYNVTAAGGPNAGFATGYTVWQGFSLNYNTLFESFYQSSVGNIAPLTDILINQQYVFQGRNGSNNPAILDDAFTGGNLADEINGNAGNDILSGGGGDDTIRGGTGNDIIDGGSGDNLLDGEDGDDRISSLFGSATMNGGNGNDTITGGLGNNLIHGGDGNDSLRGGDGNDTMFGGADQDYAFGGAGDDVIYLDAGADTLDGGTGFNILAFSSPTTIDFQNANFSGDAAGDTWTNFQAILGSEGNDIIAATVNDATIARFDGLGGNDAIGGGAGADDLRGGSGDDAVYGNGGDDRLTPGSGNDFVDGGAGFDTVDLSDRTGTSPAQFGFVVDLVQSTAKISYFDGTRFVQETDTLLGIEAVIGTDRRDFFTGNGSNTFHGGGSDDTFRTTDDQGVDTQSDVFGDDGTDTLILHDEVPVGIVAVAPGHDDTINLTAAATLHTSSFFIPSPLGGTRVTTTNTINYAGIEAIHAGDGNDTFNDGDNPTLNGPGTTVVTSLFGDAGTDTFNVSDDYSGIARNLDGGADVDAVSFAGFANTGVDIDMNRTGSEAVFNLRDRTPASDTLTSIEIVTGTNFGDSMTAMDGSTRELHGGGGNDFLASPTVRFQIFDGGDGNDTMSFANFALSNVGGISIDMNRVGAEAQFLGDVFSSTLTSIENVIGTSAADSMTSSATTLSFAGGAGNDAFRTAAGNQIVDGGADMDTAYFTGARADYAISFDAAANTYLVAGKSGTAGAADGTDTLKDVELLAFTDGTVAAFDYGSLAGGGIAGGSGSEHLIGTAGRDIFLGSLGDDILDGLGNIDTVDYSADALGVAVQLLPVGIGSGAGIGIDTLLNIENAITGSGADTVYTGDGVEVVRTNAGQDLIRGSLGDDDYDFGADIDTLLYDLQTQQVIVDLTTGQATGVEIGADTIANAEIVYTGSGNDIARAALTTLELHTADGNDQLYAGGRNLILDGGADDDTAFFTGARADYAIAYDATALTLTLTGRDGTTTVVSNVETLQFADGAVAASALSNILLNTAGGTATGTARADTFVISATTGTAAGGAGNDTYKITTGDLRGINIVEAAGAAGGTADALVIAGTLPGGVVAIGAALPANLEQLGLASGLTGPVTFTDVGGVSNNWAADWTMSAADAGRLAFNTGALADTVAFNFTITGTPTDPGRALVLLDTGTGNDVVNVGITLAPAPTGAAARAAAPSTTGPLGAEVHAGAGNDRVSASDLADKIFGDAGNDTINAKAGNDLLIATLMATGNDGDDIYYGGDGFDTADYSALTKGITVEMGKSLGVATGKVEGAQSGQDTLNSVEKVIGTQAKDKFVDRGGDNSYTSGAGADYFEFKRGFGNDTITDFKVAGADHDLIAFDHDMFAQFSTIQKLIASASLAQAGGDVVITADANDTLTLQGVSLIELRAHIDDFKWA